MESAKLKIINLLLKGLKVVTLRLLFYQAKYSAGKEVENVVKQQNFDLRGMKDRVKNVMLHDQDIIDKRLEICNSCEFLTDNNRCEKCGCFMKLKTKLKGVVCPDNPPRW